MINTVSCYREVMRDGTKHRQLVLPASMRRQALVGLHDNVGHPGRDRTISLFQDRFYWPGMTAEVEQWVKKCRRCIVRKADPKRAPLVNIRTIQPLELVCMDFLTLETSAYTCGDGSFYYICAGFLHKKHDSQDHS